MSFLYTAAENMDAAAQHANLHESQLLEVEVDEQPDIYHTHVHAAVQAQ